MMIIKRLFYLLPLSLILSSCTGDDTVQKNIQPTEQTDNKKEDSIKNTEQITFTSEEPTRTGLTHTIGGGARGFWSTGDKIWVRNKDGVFKQSSAGELSIDKSRGVFALPEDTYENGTSVNYTGKNSTSATQVTIASAQHQSDPNNFDHAGDAGDFGIGTASGSGKSFKFTIAHKASYICLLPRSGNPYVQRSKLFKIEIISEDNIAGTYNIASNGNISLASGGTNTITLSLGKEFELNNTSTNLQKNGSYVVIAPGYHRIAIRYWLRNSTDHPSGSNIEGTVTKNVNMNFEAGKIHDITSNLAPPDYSSWKFYMWDAKRDYWQGGTQSSLVGQTGTNWPTSPSDLRWYNTGTAAASNTAAVCPNVNQMLWYAHRGDWHTDVHELWIWRQHMWKGGAWVLRRSYFNMDANKAPDGHDYRSVSMQSVNQGRAYVSYPITKFTRPAGSQISRYFFLPYFGNYQDGKYSKNDASYGYYHTSTPYPGNLGAAYYIDFYTNGIFVAQGNRWTGACSVSFP